ncbi:hypothetical protein Aduo_018181 [Ancylostoma duodenale]
MELGNTTVHSSGHLPDCSGLNVRSARAFPFKHSISHTGLARHFQSYMRDHIYDYQENEMTSNYMKCSFFQGFSFIVLYDDRRGRILGLDMIPDPTVGLDLNNLPLLMYLVLSGEITSVPAFITQPPPPRNLPIEDIINNSIFVGTSALPPLLPQLLNPVLQRANLFLPPFLSPFHPYLANLAGSGSVPRAIANVQPRVVSLQGGINTSSFENSQPAQQPESDLEDPSAAEDDDDFPEPVDFILFLGSLWALKCKTVTAIDVVYALERQGRTLYGFGG